MRKIILIPIIAFLISLGCNRVKPIQFYSGTTCLVLVEGDTAYIAADSKANTTIGDITTKTQKIDKIRKRAAIFYVVCGFGSVIMDLNGKTWFDANQIINSSIGGIINIDSVVSSAGKNLANKLDAVFAKSDEKSQFDLIEASRKGGLRIAVVSNHNLPIQVRTFSVKLVEGNAVYKYAYIVDPLLSRNFYAIGEWNAIYKAILEDSKILKSRPLHKVLSNLIALEVKANPDKVGGPVDVAEVYKGGCKWYHDIPIK